MVEAVLQELETYSSRHQNTVSHFIATRPIMDLCLKNNMTPPLGTGRGLDRRLILEEGGSGREVEGVRHR